MLPSEIRMILETTDRDYDAQTLRQKQLEHADKAFVNPGTDPDDRTYKGLSNTGVPMALDAIGLTPWTLDEIVQAMYGVVRSFAIEFGGKRAGYQVDDALSIGLEAVLDSLHTDKGMAPFGKYAARNARLAIAKGSRQAGIIPVPQRKQRHTDRDTSMDIMHPEKKGTMAGALSADAPVITGKEKCAVCLGKGYTVDVDGDQEDCIHCGGRGYVVKKVKRKDFIPDKELESQEKLGIVKKAVRELIDKAGLSDRQKEAFLLFHGLEGQVSDELVHTGQRKQLKAIADIMSAAETIYDPSDIPGKYIPDKGNSLWDQAQKLDKVNEFQNAWIKTFKSLGDEAEDFNSEQVIKPFNPNLPVALQIAPLVWSYTNPKTGYNVDANYIPDLIKNIGDALGVEPKMRTKSRNAVAILFKKIDSKIEKARQEIEEPDVFECIEKLYELQMQTLSECIERGTLDPEDLILFK